jgi:general secretion pathway protein B
MPILAPPRLAPAAPTVAAAAAAPAKPAPSASVSSGSASSVAATVTPPPAVTSFADLSPEARAQLPAVSVSGSTYSQNPALRMLIANGKVVQEGQDIAPGLRLETIGPRSAVLNHQGLRYSIGY